MFDYMAERFHHRCLKVRPIIPGVLVPPQTEPPKTYGDDHGYRSGQGVGNPIAVDVAFFHAVIVADSAAPQVSARH